MSESGSLTFTEELELAREVLSDFSTVRLPGNRFIRCGDEYVFSGVILDTLFVDSVARAQGEIRSMQKDMNDAPTILLAIAVPLVIGAIVGWWRLLT